MSNAGVGKTGVWLASVRQAGIVILIFALMGIYIKPGLAQQNTKQPAAATTQSNAACGQEPLSIAAMQWPSSVILAYVHAIILEKELGCRVQIVTGDLAATISSMAATGKPDIAPEVWATRIADIWNSAIEAGRVLPMGATYDEQTFEGWYIPAHVQEAFPGLNGVKDLTGYVEALGKQGLKAKFISCPADWACAVINRNMLIALGLETSFDIVEPANRFAMDTLIARAVSHRQPVVFYYWRPNAILAQFNFKALDMGPFNAEKFKCLAHRVCANPEFSAFANEQVFLVTTDQVADKLPKVAQYLRQARMPIAQMNTILSWQAQNGSSYKDLAARFVAEREDVWRPWLAGL